jgi:diacylglycerol kinase (ATP)
MRNTIILNPAAGRGQGRKRLAELQALLEREGVGRDWQIVETDAPGQATGIARQRAEAGAPIVAAAGGDGTLNEVVNGLVGTGAQLGLLPLGTGNDFARCLGIGTDLSFAVSTLVRGVARPVDLGQARGRWFLNIAGCGFDAIVAERVNRGFRSLHGTGAYLAAVAQSLIALRPAEMRLTLDGEALSVRALMCSVANSTSYGGGMLIAPNAQLDDGLFDICLLREAGRIEFLRAFPRVFKGTHITHPKVTMLRAKVVGVESDPPLPILIDGDVIGTTPVTFTLTPAAIHVLAPIRPNG